MGKFFKLAKLKLTTLEDLAKTIGQAIAKSAPVEKTVSVAKAVDKPLKPKSREELARLLTKPRVKPRPEVDEGTLSKADEIWKKKMLQQAREERVPGTAKKLEKTLSKEPKMRPVRPGQHQYENR